MKGICYKRVSLYLFLQNYSMKYLYAICRGKKNLIIENTVYCKLPIIETKLNYMEAFPIKQSDLRKDFRKIKNKTKSKCIQIF